MQLVRQTKSLEKSHVGRTVKKRLQQFASFEHKGYKEWFSELCFCLLTANAKGKNAFNIQQQLGLKGFCDYSAEDIRECIVRNKHRFHNTKTNYIISAREHKNLKSIIKKIVMSEGQYAAREWLVKNVKGLGYKEASHFLRNVGYNNLAIIDRHVLNVLAEYRIIKKPKNMGRKSYLQCEKVLSEIAKKLKMSLGELDLYLWYMKTGEVLK